MISLCNSIVEDIGSDRLPDRRKQFSLNLVTKSRNNYATESLLQNPCRRYLLVMTPKPNKRILLKS